MITECNVNYEGSITIDPVLLQAADILPYERVEVVNINNSTRFSTYVIEGRPNSGDICLNGAAARLGARNDIVIILAYHEVPDDQCTHVKPRLIYVDARNHMVPARNTNAWVDDLIPVQ